jgi:Protein of unknown function (DUF952)
MCMSCGYVLWLSSMQKAQYRHRHDPVTQPHIGLVSSGFTWDAVQDGFIHLTADPKLLLEVANRFYVASQGDWEVLVIDPAKLTAEVRAVSCC